jgi:hypothetical protein
MRTKYIVSALMLGACSTMASAEDSGWALHGFGDISVKNDYVTPRGLVVTTAGTTIQVLNGLVAVAPNGVAFHAGTWVDINPGYSRAHGNITAVNEFDYFFGVDYDVLPKLNVGVEYSEFISGQPSVAFKNEHNIEFSFKYKDGSPDKPYSINPYAKVFWAVSSKSSTVVLGKSGKTFDVELGAVPTYKTGALTLSAPTWITVGPKTYWGLGTNTDGNVGVFSTGLKASTPLPFKPGGAGASVYVFGQYYALLNDNLVVAKSLLNGGAHKKSQFQFGGGISFGF